MMWKDKYKVGVKNIDDQHRELFKRLSDFIQTVQSDLSWEDKLGRVKETMNFMQEYVEYHFDDEERYQEKINYPDMELHKEVHAKFKGEMYKYVEIFDKGQFTEKRVQEFSAKLMTWLIMHVGKMDQKIGEYIREKGGKQ